MGTITFQFQRHRKIAESMSAHISINSGLRLGNQQSANAIEVFICKFSLSGSLGFHEQGEKIYGSDGIGRLAESTLPRAVPSSSFFMHKFSDWNFDNLVSCAGR